MLRKFLLTKYRANGHVDTIVGNQGDIIEYGDTPEIAKSRAAVKFGGSPALYKLVGEIR